MPVDGTKPPIAFMSDDFPAPFAPIRPTISRGADAQVTRRPQPARRSEPSHRARKAIRRAGPQRRRRAPDRRAPGSRCRRLGAARAPWGAGRRRRAPSASRTRYATSTKPPGKNRSSTRRPTADTRSGAAAKSGKRAGGRSPTRAQHGPDDRTQAADDGDGDQRHRLRRCANVALGRVASGSAVT